MSLLIFNVSASTILSSSNFCYTPFILTLLLLSSATASFCLPHTYDYWIWRGRKTKQLVKENKRSQHCVHFHNEARFNFVSIIHSHLYVHNHAQAWSIVLRVTSIYKQKKRSN